MSSTLGADFAYILGRDLESLAVHISRYPDDASLWRTGGTTKNAPGSLALHLVGNLRHFVGAILGGSDYVRDRDAEFSTTGLGREELVARIRACRAEVVPILEALQEDALSGPYPGEVPPHMKGATTRRFLLHLSGHLMWHLGQVDYHWRLLVESDPG